jgi:hypothetical protein
MDATILHIYQLWMNQSRQAQDQFRCKEMLILLRNR